MASMQAGGRVLVRDSNLDSNATSLTERRELASLYYDKKVIAPLWMKVSTTPWTAYAKAAGGYGRVIDDTSVSHDSPSFMQIPEVMAHIPQTGQSGEFGGTRKAKFQHRDDTTISDDAPDWFRIPSVVNWKANQKTNPDPGHIKMVLGKEIIFEPKPKKSDTGSINWSITDSHDSLDRQMISHGSSRQPTARQPTARDLMFS
tara:strand:+ start:137 stop:742 length:606 start_codon:yes stop_codon:yes gene_type:complete